MIRVVRPTFCCLTLLSAVLGSQSVQTTLAGPELLVRAVIDGRESSLYEKVVVTSSRATIASTPGGQGEPIEPFAIFFKLKTDDGQKEQNGFVRIGSSQGDPIGWIKKTDVTEWNTRFVLEPLQPVPGRTFTLFDETGKEPRAQLSLVAGGQRRFALITNSANDKESQDSETDYSVVVYAGNVQAEGTGGTIAKERNALNELKLEVMFVIEETDFLLSEFDGVVLGDSLKDVLRTVVSEIERDSKLKGAVRLGLATYQDNSREAEYAAKLRSPLTDNLSDFLAAVNGSKPMEIKGDWPEDVVSGLNTAVSDAGWSENSSKHVILLGQASCQLQQKGENTSNYGGMWNSFTKPIDDQGWNSCGLSIRQLIAKANPQAGSAEQKARNAKTFHTAWIGKKLPPQLEDPKLKEIVGKIVRLSDNELEDLIDNGVEVDTVVFAFKLFLIQHQRELATAQYKELSANDGVQGLNLVVEPTASDVTQAVRRITSMMVNSLQTLTGVRDGTVAASDLKSSEESSDNAITQTFYQLVGAAAEKFKDSPALSGIARTRDDRGREVAHRKVLVARLEVERLKSTLDAIHKKFQARVAKADRQDVTQILDELKQLTVQTTSGQKALAADVQLKDAITDLPLRTTALETTPRDIAVMPSDAFKQWLNKLESAKFRADDLLNGKAEWLELSSRYKNEKYTFLHLNELP